MFCTKCGSPMGENDLFCQACGTPRSQETAPVTPEPLAANPYERAYGQPDPQQPYQQPYQQQAYGQPDPQQSYQQPTYQQPYQAYDPAAWQQPAAPVAEKKRGRKGLVIGLGCVALAALVAGGVWFLTRNRGSQNKVLAAAEKSLAALEDYTEDLPNLNAIVRGLEALEDSDALHVEFGTLNSYAYDDEEERSELSVKLDLNAEARKVQADVSYENNGTKVSGVLYGDPEQILLTSDSILEPGEALRLPLEDFVNRWNASELSKLTNVTIPADYRLPSPSEDPMTEVYGETWTKFLDSVDTKAYEGTPRFTGDGVTYTLTWDQSLLDSLYNSTEEKGTDLDMENILELTGEDMDKKVAGFVVSTLHELAEELKETQFYVEKGRLTGLFVGVREGSAVEVRLVGEDNPWERITVTVIEKQYDGGAMEQTVELRLSKTKGQLRLEASPRRSGAAFSDPEEIFALLYNDADGKISLTYGGEAADEDTAYSLVPKAGGFEFSLTEDYASTYYSETVRQAFCVAPGTGELKAPGTKVVDLLSLSQSELEDLFQRISEKAGGLFNPSYGDDDWTDDWDD